MHNHPTQWIVSGDPESDKHENEWHVLPCNDLKPHTESRDCACKPKLDAAHFETHNRLIFVHESYDKREYTYEKGMVH